MILGQLRIWARATTYAALLHSGPEMINFGKVEQISLPFISICLFVYHLWHSLATRHPLEPKNTLFCSHSLIRPGQRIWEIEQLLDNAAYLTCHFKGCLMVVLLKSHSLLTNKTDTLSKWDGVAKPGKYGSFLILVFSSILTILCVSGGCKLALEAVEGRPPSRRARARFLGDGEVDNYSHQLH